MGDLTCPACGHVTAEPRVIQGLTICAGCLRTVNVSVPALATGADTVPLSARDLADLRELRKTLRASREAV